MILEVADIRIQPGRQAEFDAAIQHGVNTVISQAKGFAGFKVNKGIESPERYLLMIWWETLENHTVDFRESPAFLECAASSARSSRSRRRSSTSSCWPGRPEAGSRDRPAIDPPRRKGLPFLAGPSWRSVSSASLLCVGGGGGDQASSWARIFSRVAFSSTGRW